MRILLLIVQVVLFAAHIADSVAPDCSARGVCDPLIEEVLGVYIETSVEEVNSKNTNMNTNTKTNTRYRSTRP